MLTKLDILDSFDVVKICTSYSCNGRIYDYLPASYTIQEKLEPIYEEFSGWKESTHGKKSIEELPINLIRYVKKIEELIGVPIYLISTSPNRRDIIEF